MSGLIKWQPFNWLLLLWWLQGRVDEGVDKSKWNIPSNRFWLVLLTLSLQTNSLREGGIGFLPLSVDQTSLSRESMNVNSTVKHIRPAEGDWHLRVPQSSGTTGQKPAKLCKMQPLVTDAAEAQFWPSAWPTKFSWTVVSSITSR